MNKNAKSTRNRPLRNRRVLSVSSTSFSGRTPDFEAAMIKANSGTTHQRRNHRSTFHDMNEEEKVDSTPVIKEVESEEDDKESSEEVINTNGKKQQSSDSDSELSQPTMS